MSKLHPLLSAPAAAAAAEQPTVNMLPEFTDEGEIAAIAAFFTLLDAENAPMLKATYAVDKVPDVATYAWWWARQRDHAPVTHAQRAEALRLCVDRARDFAKRCIKEHPEYHAFPPTPPSSNPKLKRVFWAAVMVFLMRTHQEHPDLNARLAAHHAVYPHWHAQWKRVAAFFSSNSKKKAKVPLQDAGNTLNFPGRAPATAKDFSSFLSTLPKSAQPPPVAAAAISVQRPPPPVFTHEQLESIAFMQAPLKFNGAPSSEANHDAEEEYGEEEEQDENKREPLLPSEPSHLQPQQQNGLFDGSDPSQLPPGVPPGELHSPVFDGSDAAAAFGLANDGYRSPGAFSLLDRADSRDSFAHARAMATNAMAAASAAASAERAHAAHLPHEEDLFDLPDPDADAPVDPAHHPNSAQFLRQQPPQQQQSVQSSMQSMQVVDSPRSDVQAQIHAQLLDQQQRFQRLQDELRVAQNEKQQLAAQAVAEQQRLQNQLVEDRKRADAEALRLDQRVVDAVGQAEAADRRAADLEKQAAALQAEKAHAEGLAHRMASEVAAMRAQAELQLQQQQGTVDKKRKHDAQQQASMEQAQAARDKEMQELKDKALKAALKADAFLRKRERAEKRLEVDRLRMQSLENSKRAVPFDEKMVATFGAAEVRNVRLNAYGACSPLVDHLALLIQDCRKEAKTEVTVELVMRRISPVFGGKERDIATLLAAVNIQSSSSSSSAPPAAGAGAGAPARTQGRPPALLQLQQKPSADPSRCMGCGVSTRLPVSCSRCHDAFTAFYCSLKCRDACAAKHAKECVPPSGRPD